jgi:hypothetical protein
MLRRTRFCGAEVTSGPTLHLQKNLARGRPVVPGQRGDMMEDQVRRDAAPVHGITSPARVGQSSLRNFRILQ